MARRNSPGPPCSLCVHPDREAIESCIVAGEAIAAIARKFDLSEHSARTHAKNHVSRELVKAEDAYEAIRAGNILQELETAIHRVTLLSNACHEELKDPDDPTKYCLAPRAEELVVLYLDQGPEGKPIRKKAALSTLLPLIEVDGREVVKVESKTADPRVLLLQAYDRLQGRLQLAAQILGHLKAGDTVVHGDLVMTAEFVQLQAVLIPALAPIPGAAEAAQRALAAFAESTR